MGEKYLVEGVDTMDDSIEVVFKNDMLGNMKFSNGWYMAFALRYTNTCNRIVKIKRNGIEDNLRILDLGCSNRTFQRFWGKNFESPGRPRIDYVGLEFRQDVVDEANKDLVNKGVNSVEVFQFNLVEQSLYEVNKFEKYDVILMQEILEHIPEDTVKKLLKEAHSLLNDRGFIVVSSPNPRKDQGQEFVWPENHVQEFSLDEMKSLLSEQYNIERVNGWLGKAQKFKKNLTPSQREEYDAYNTLSSGFASAVIAHRYPEHAECYTIIATKKDSE